MPPRGPRLFIERRDILAIYTDDELLTRYRFDREGILFLDAMIHDMITPSTDRNHSVSSVHKILITLRYLATGKMQLCEADCMGVSQPTVSRVISQVLDALSSDEIVLQYIKCPITYEELQHHQQNFYAIGHFPGVVGLIDGTHVQVQAPSIDEDTFVNRQRYHSINVQLVFDSNDIIIDCVAKYPGATHDSRILQESGLRQIFENGFMPRGQFHLLGDSGYPCKRWLLTPFRNPDTESKMRYNR